ncbi:IS200/IS605 family transposase [Gelidibacter japonicus]|jgi:REP element-mobilizing transposase RayT|uniref:IS200/IS605 family transposase n=1 Tax=Gelidibacter japonicus TaxID=1962232 RepID=UPI00202223A2|nr:IS200/IS605 family transposase [Gelidibacter japonicus]MCL8008630.1 IS200/IS605 family transposase [Gelidibacter japonicus]
MSNTFTQLYVQIIFAVMHKNALIDQLWEERLYRYITGIIQNKGNKMIAINGMPNHIHLFIGMIPDISMSDLVREVKKSSTNFINGERLSSNKFQWQPGYGAFSFGRSDIDPIAKHIMNQKEYHKSNTFKEEYLGLLKTFGIDYNENYLFDWMED